MIVKTSRKERTRRRHSRVRKKVFGTGARPRLSIFRSNKHIYAQLIDDENAKTLLFCSTLQPKVKSGLKTTWSKEASSKVGEMIAKSALEKGIKKVIFDRGGNRYHGKILTFADSARSAGLEF